MAQEKMEGIDIDAIDAYVVLNKKDSSLSFSSKTGIICEFPDIPTSDAILLLESMAERDSSHISIEKERAIIERAQGILLSPIPPIKSITFNGLGFSTILKKIVIAASNSPLTPPYVGLPLNREENFKKPAALKIGLSVYQKLNGLDKEKNTDETFTLAAKRLKEVNEKYEGVIKNIITSFNLICTEIAPYQNNRRTTFFIPTYSRNSVVNHFVTANAWSYCYPTTTTVAQDLTKKIIITKEEHEQGFLGHIGITKSRLATHLETALKKMADQNLIEATYLETHKAIDSIYTFLRKYERNKPGVFPSSEREAFLDKLTSATKPAEVVNKFNAWRSEKNHQFTAAQVQEIKTWENTFTQEKNAKKEKPDRRCGF